MKHGPFPVVRVKWDRREQLGVAQDLRITCMTPDGWDSQRFLGRELLTVRSTQTVATAPSAMSTAKPLLPEIAPIMVTSLKAPYSSPLQHVPDPH